MHCRGAADGVRSDFRKSDVAKLSADDLTKLAEALPPGVAAGERYPAEALAHMDSEKKRA
jgi:hypothetical protein